MMMFCQMCPFCFLWLKGLNFECTMVATKSWSGWTVGSTLLDTHFRQSASCFALLLGSSGLPDGIFQTKNPNLGKF
jgi:hypothetical protein